VIFASLDEMTDQAARADSAVADGELIDRLVHTSVFGAGAEMKGTARWLLRRFAAAAGIRPASIHELYMAMGRGSAGGFTVPAINVRAIAYDTARAVLRAANGLNAGAFIFEISRSEIRYTAQRPHEYAAVVIAAALREGFSGPLFIQGDHVQANARKYHSHAREAELASLRALIVEEVAAGFYNIDIDSSTLVDLERETLDQQQSVNADLAADLTAFVRRHEPPEVTISIGGEIGEVGGRNSNVHELRAFMDGYNAALERRGSDYRGISKVSVQTGTEHGGMVNADGTLRTDVNIDLPALEELSRVARREYGLGGAVQHGASTLPADAFEAFPRAGACEIHLATGFQNLVFEHPGFPADLRDEMYGWIREHAAAERKPADTEQQFVYKTRKFALSAFKQQMWEISADRRGAIGEALEAEFTRLMRALHIGGTAPLVAGLVAAPPPTPDLDKEIAAAGAPRLL
jgi:fructose/tagatose bisphosphate aldolase